MWCGDSCLNQCDSIQSSPNVLRVFLEVLTHILNVLFKGILLLRFLLALYGPSNIVCPLYPCVKDMPVHNCGYLRQHVLDKGHAVFWLMVEPFYRSTAISIDTGQWSLPSTSGCICARVIA